MQGIISPTKKKRLHSDHASKKSEKKKKKSKSSQPPPISSLAVSDDNHGADLEEPTSLPKSSTTSKLSSFLDSLFQAPYDYDEPFSSAPLSPTRFHSVLESPSHHVSLDYNSLEEDNQDDAKQSKPENFPQDYHVQDNSDEDTPMRTVDIPSSEGLIVDDETNDMSIVLYSNASAKTFNTDLDDYSPPTPKESQEKDVVNEPNLSSFSQDPIQDDSTPKETNEDNTTETELERIILTA
ncbi:unnamed protein product [Lactuca saligna]|uniref:Uncharacterized protein n=1 Tax=Lactuca saligna TaxID=75948 RepID=A0AA36EDV1_LACSI|nr:unnamed protein product [Lactuca saligna]